MKKKVLFFVAIIALTVAGIVGTVKTTSADINPECPNGCLANGNGCYCYQWYSCYLEATHKEDLMDPTP